MPQPRFGDIREFCRIDGWEQTTTAKGKKVGDHFRYRKTLPDGTILRTRASHGNDQIGDPALWKRIWSEQLGLDNEQQFWDALNSGKPVPRGTTEPAAPAGPSLPLWLYRKLLVEVRVPEAELASLSEAQALARLHEHYARPQDE
jgi:hypothetical protein